MLFYCQLVRACNRLHLYYLPISVVYGLSICLNRSELQLQAPISPVPQTAYWAMASNLSKESIVNPR